MRLAYCGKPRGAGDAGPVHGELSGERPGGGLLETAVHVYARETRACDVDGEWTLGRADQHIGEEGAIGGTTGRLQPVAARLAIQLCDDIGQLHPDIGACGAQDCLGPLHCSANAERQRAILV